MTEHTHTPIRARLSQLHQRIILTIRWWFRLPIDDIREQQRDRVDEHFLQMFQTQSAMISELNARLKWYETRVPMLKKEYRLLHAHQQKQFKAEELRRTRFNELVASGVAEAVAREQVWPGKAGAGG